MRNAILQTITYSHRFILKGGMIRVVNRTAPYISTTKNLLDQVIGMIPGHEAREEDLFVLFCEDGNGVFNHDIGLFLHSRHIGNWNQDFRFLAEDGLIVKVRVEAESLVCHIEFPLN